MPRSRDRAGDDAADAGADDFAAHDPRTISRFEILGSYFVDTVYNHVYKSAATSATSSLRDEYVRRLQAYLAGVKTDSKCYDEVVRGLHQYFSVTTRRQGLSFAAFVDDIVSVCVPEQYFRLFTAAQKDELLCSAVCELVAALVVAASRPEMLVAVVDRRAQAIADGSYAATVRQLQDAAVNALVVKRASLFNKFLRRQAQARDQVSPEVLTDVKRALRRLAKEKAEALGRVAELELERDGLEREREGLAHALEDARVRELKLRKLVELLRQGQQPGGPAAAGMQLLAPPTDAGIAEPPPVAPPAPSDLRRERIAEPESSSEESESEEESESVEDDSEDDSEEESAEEGRHRRRRRPASKSKPAPRHRRPAAAAGAVPVARMPPGKQLLDRMITSFTGDEELDSALAADE